MKSLANSLALLAALLTTSPCEGADLVLRERATQHGAVIRLGDVADISTASSTELSRLANTPLLPAPAEGTQQFLNVSQIRELLAARGILLNRLSFRGAKVVEIGAAAKPLKVDAKAMPPKQSRQEVELRVQRAIERHLQSGSKESRWRVDLLLDKGNLVDVAHLEEELLVRGRPQPRSGRERFFLRDGENKQEFAVTADVAKIQSVVMVKHRIERGQLIRASDVELRKQAGNVPSGSLIDLQQVIGTEAQRALRPDVIVQKSHIRRALQVRRGETVNVFVRTGGVAVRTRAIAKANGAMGDLIALESLEGKKRLDASVSGPGEVTLYAAGAQATDYASLHRDASHEKLRRR